MAERLNPALLHPGAAAELDGLASGIYPLMRMVIALTDAFFRQRVRDFSGGMAWKIHW
ncbi:hypothetical protein [Agrobacterium vitis]|uniref:hypothetical protein n=1 Tax=Agrobacterium vitis TaxID=373 RepID=UPI001574CDDB|nr:hypothetical protein [Agrobacterium vitis]NSZ16177.1 hypothetical protein [Agrobacterium vitis]QZO04944.1 hypothetical protein K4831_05260 [Agrobacterium vitis]UJL87092.1 hypothetical protein AVF2S5_03600 [Agrobacterium vitis]